MRNHRPGTTSKESLGASRKSVGFTQSPTKSGSGIGRNEAGSSIRYMSGPGTYTGTVAPSGPHVETSAASQTWSGCP